MASTLEIIIVNRNSGQHLRKCLESITTADKTGITLCRICVVDDCSSDDSMGNIDQIPLPLDVIWRNVRTGYGGSCNRGAAHSVADYLLFLNTDTCLHNKSLTVPVHYMENGENACVGIVGIKLLDEHGIVTRFCSRFPTIRSQFTAMLGDR